MFIALAAVMIMGTLVAANLGEGDAAWRTGAYSIFIGLCGGAFVLGALALGNVPALGGGTRAVIGFSLETVTAAAAPLCLVRGVRLRVARLLHSFSPESSLHAVSLGLYFLFFTFQVSQQVAVDQLKSFASTGGQASSTNLAYLLGTSSAPMFAIAIVGVGLFSRRSLRETAARLGLTWPRWRWLLASLGVVVVLLVLDVGFGALMQTLTPQQNKALSEVTKNLFGSINTLPQVIALGIGAGVGEELLFRGALLPRFGNLLTALLFAAAHVQYAVSIATLEIFVLGLVLGWLRRRAGTTGCIVAHAGYDIAIGMLTLVPK